MATIILEHVNKNNSTTTTFKNDTDVSIKRKEYFKSDAELERVLVDAQAEAIDSGVLDDSETREQFNRNNEEYRKQPQQQQKVQPSDLGKKLQNSVSPQRLNSDILKSNNLYNVTAEEIEAEAKRRKLDNLTKLTPKSAQAIIKNIQNNKALTKQKQPIKNPTAAVHNAKIDDTKFDNNISTAINVASMLIPQARGISAIAKGLGLAKKVGITPASMRKVLRGDAAIGKSYGDKILKTVKDSTQKFTSNPVKAINGLVVDAAKRNIKLPSQVTDAIAEVQNTKRIGSIASHPEQWTDSEVGAALSLLNDTFITSNIAKNKQLDNLAKNEKIGKQLTAEAFNKSNPTIGGINESNINTYLYVANSSNKKSKEYKKALASLKNSGVDMGALYSKLNIDEQTDEQKAQDEYDASIIDTYRSGTKADRKKYSPIAKSTIAVQNFNDAKSELFEAVNNDDSRAILEARRKLRRSLIDYKKIASKNYTGLSQSEVKTRNQQLQSLIDETKQSNNQLLIYKLNASDKLVNNELSERQRLVDAKVIDSVDDPKYKTITQRLKDKNVNPSSVFVSGVDTNSPEFVYWTGNAQYNVGAFDRMIDELYRLMSGLHHSSRAMQPESFSVWIYTQCRKVDYVVGKTDVGINWMNYGIIMGKLGFDRSQFEYDSDGRGESNGLLDIIDASVKWLGKLTASVPTDRDFEIFESVKFNKNNI